MKYLLLVLLLTNVVFATAQTSAQAYYPHGADSYQKVQDDLISANTTASALSTPLVAKLSDLDANNSVNGINVERMVRFQYNIATAPTGTVGAHLTGASLPAKAVITNSFCYTDVRFVDSGSGSVALSCEDADNILTAGDITGNVIGTIIVGGPKYSAPISAIASACNITATVAGADQSAGKLTCWIKYVIHD